MGERSSTNLAATKLRPPVPPSRLVERARLGAVLDDADAADVPLVLVSAPAGSGKSTLVAGWAAAHPDRVAWLQLEDADADPARFWVSVAAAIGRTRPDVGALLAPVVTGSLGAGHVVVPALVNEMAALSERLVVVLDDYHLIDDADVHRSVERLVELCPPQLTLVLITRADPPFRLGRMRVRGRVREIRATDLRFDTGEAADLLGAAAAGLDGRRLDELCDRTEGWAAGLVLAGLSLARTTDADRFVETFRGDDQLVAGYLTDELLAVLDPDERRRIVEAAVLHRLSGPLLDAVTGSDDGARWLDALAARNQLVIRLDTVGEWYRYHHLFRDMLLLEARRSIPDRLPELHRRAAEWFEAAGFAAAAVDHLLAAGDRAQAMSLMRIVGPDLLGSGRLRTLRNILERLSVEGELDAICLTLSGWDHYLTGRYDAAQLLLDRATATLPDDIDPMRLMPLRINLALGTGRRRDRARRRSDRGRGRRPRVATERADHCGRRRVRVGRAPRRSACRAPGGAGAHPGRAPRDGARDGPGRHRRRRVPRRVRRRGSRRRLPGDRLRHIVGARGVPRHRARRRHPGSHRPVRRSGDCRRRARCRARTPRCHHARAGVRPDPGRRRAAPRGP